MTDITPVINAAIALIGAVLTAFVVPWLKRKTTAYDRQEMLEWVDIAVSAAQQLYHQLSGRERKDYVIRFLEERGYSIEDDALNNAIESAVLKLHHEMGEQNVGSR